jgi:hypothetical protein
VDVSRPVRADEDAREHAPDVRVEDRGVLTVGERQHGARRIAADTGKAAEAVRSVGEPAAVTGHCLARDLVQTDGPDVVAERVPQPADIADSGAGQILERGIALEELVVLRYDAIDLGLLEHDLGDEHAVGIARASPGKIATMPRVPGQQSALKCAHDAWVWLDHARSLARPPRAGAISSRGGTMSMCQIPLRSTQPCVEVLASSIAVTSESSR